MTTDARAPLRRPMPVPDEWSEAYWAGACARRLLITRCDACTRYVHPPQPVCPSCRHESLTAVEVSGRGRVYGFSIMHLPGVPGFEPPFAVAVVELAEQDGLLTVGNVLNCAFEDITVGMPVEVTFEVVSETVTLPQWQPVAER
jgi:uncharacterized OB-fold protein